MVVVGCGFAGSAAVRELVRIARGSVDIVAYDKQPCLYNYPVLPRLLNEAVANDRIEVPLTRLFHQLPVDLRQERVAAIDSVRRVIHTREGEKAYDFLVLAPGSRALPLQQDDGMSVFYPKALRHLRQLTERIATVAAELASEAHADAQEPHRIAVVGGGLTGVEFAMAIREAADRACNSLPIARHSFTISLYERADRLNPLGPARLSMRLERELTGYGVGLVLGRDVHRVSRQGLVTAAATLPVDTVVCCIGSRPNLRIDLMGLPVGNQGIVVDPALRCEGLDEVFVIGDGMLFREDYRARLDIRQAHRAAAQGRHVARNIARLIRGREPRPYRPLETPIGVMLQSRRGVFSYRNRCFGGTLAGYAKRWLELRHT